MTAIKIPLLFAFGLMTCTVSALAQTGGCIAGLQPDRRPDAAPQVTETARTPEQVERALHGIEKPAPGNVETIAATGNWWVPLRYPGMNAPYDLRGWHHDAQAQAAPSNTASSLR